MKKLRYCELGLAVIETEAQAILGLARHIDERFEKACDILLGCKGRIVVTGMGKSGHIAGKIAATLASTGSPAFFVHPGEASHGDMGMITTQDVVLAISNSGHTAEILTLIPIIKRLGVPLITMTGLASSELARRADVNLDVTVEREACPMGLAPTSSTTAALVMGDALAIALLQTRGFTPEDFALSHPGGILGRRLLLRVDDCIASADAMPFVSEQATLSEALLEMTAKKLGMTCVVDPKHRLLGVFTDGDLRRALQHSIDIHTTPISSLMNQHAKTIKRGMLAAEALTLMEHHKITSLVVVDDQESPIGVLHMHALISAGVV